MLIFIRMITPYIALIQAILATLTSLYFSEIRHFPPCVLCWYQRIFMYPLIIILVVGILKRDKNLPFYVLPLSISGMVIAIYHNLLYYNVLPESVAPCRLGVSCTTQFVQLFGFATIPLMSLTAFVIITILMIIVKNQNQNKK